MNTNKINPVSIWKNIIYLRTCNSTQVTSHEAQNESEVFFQWNIQTHAEIMNRYPR